MRHELMKNVALGLASAGAIGSGGAMSGEAGSAVVGLGLASAVILLSQVARIEDDDKSELRIPRGSNRKLYTTMAAVAAAGSGAFVESLYWVEDETATAVTGWSHHINTNDLIKFVPAKIGNAVVNALGFENCTAPSITNHVSISINNGSYPASLHLPTCVSAQFGNVVQAFRGDNFVVNGFRTTLSAITEVVNKAANTDGWYATLQYVPQSVLNNAHLIQSIAGGLVLGSILAIAVTKAFRRETK